MINLLLHREYHWLIHQPVTIDLHYVRRPLPEPLPTTPLLHGLSHDRETVRTVPLPSDGSRCLSRDTAVPVRGRVSTNSIASTSKCCQSSLSRSPPYRRLSSSG